ncbi:hypothetical protein C9J48_08745 [Photobacterium profundum]|uniref:Polymorphic membrane protein n=1 Tax=Photobacterium profundum 3TCK TaxID=314280 RepID=Q1ZB66_9GAMM|nr:right-handed parallel beta-helix repeat-containing protein [Photobacterium profundum]EAS45276.1 Polymorphic membrane protein [Photobacterium profundum 3TCK]PSV63527.1 hypothetical protein C9J48_08745 [Photobacterium profundum]
MLLSGVTVRLGDVGEDYAGGGILASGGSGTRLTIKQCVITANEGKWGGGLSHETIDGILHIKSSYFTDNKTTRFGGGGIRLSGTDSTTTIKGSTVSRNEGISERGGIEHFSTGGDLTIRNSLISNNTVTEGHGGGISHDGNDDGSLTIYGSRIQGDFAETSGGGMFDESTGEDNVISLVGVSIKGNTANAGDGGGILQSEATLNVKFSTIRNNTDVGGEAPDCSGTLNARYFVLIGDPTGCTIIE